MDLELTFALEAYRSKRHFDSGGYVKAKGALINAYFKQNGLRGCVVGLSGGVDSAVTLGILAYAARQPNSPIYRILALLLPMHGEGATNQDIALSRGAEVAAKFSIECVTIDLSSTLAAATQASRAGTGIKGSAWASGQIVSYLRTPMLYYQTALLTEQGFRAVLCGTTNRDEGSYIGFFGKASDGMVDIQPISDIHKSEVYQVAKELDVPISVREAVPTGDTYDGACDEEMIGASYDSLELYTWYLCANIEEREIWHRSLSFEAREKFDSSVEKFERLHQVNTHKYIGDSPAVHLDIYSRAVPGGWRDQDPEPFNFEHTARLKNSALAARVGPIELSSRVELALRNSSFVTTPPRPIADFGESSIVLPHILSPEVCNQLIHHRDDWNWITADRHGRAIDHSSMATVELGSYRATAYNEEIASLLWDRMASFLPPVRTMNDFTPTDWGNHPVWRPVGINPMLRFIRYEKGGVLVPHYDAGFDFKDRKKHTLMSVVITLTATAKGEEDVGGRTRFLLDRQRFLPLDERNYSDHVNLGRDSDVLAEVKADQGDVLILDHRILHDGSMWHGTGPRIILRTDIIFEQCASHVLNFLQPTRLEVPAAKWARDPFFKKAYLRFRDEATIEDAGYFDDSLQEDPLSDPKWWSAPFNKILNALSQPEAKDPSRELFVLLSTGAFCPVHAGHLEMMEKAKLALEERGHVVLGGYLAPDHDAYVSAKCGNESLSAPLRLELCERAVKDSDWLMVERWAALHVPTAVNFTTIIERLQKYLAYHVRTHRPIQIAFVFGSDNAGFAKAFVGRGSCVCVLRPSYETQLENVARDPLISANPRIIFCRKKTQPWASSHVRNGNVEGLPEDVKTEWTRIRRMNAESVIPELVLMSLYVRNEGNWAIQSWASLPGMDEKELSEAYQDFLRGLFEALDQSLSNGRKTEGGPEVQVVILELEKQKILFDKLIKSSSVISLDPCLPSKDNIAVSRCFEPLNAHSLPFEPRPGADSLSVQIKRLKDTSYVLFDDDTFTGATSIYIRRLLSESTSSQAKISQFITLCGADGPATAANVSSLNDSQEMKKVVSNNPPRLNHIDCRDFLIGAREAGLVIKLPDDTLCRAPYILPYVRPYYHVSVYVSEEIRFSTKIWDLNKRFFEAVGRGRLRIRDCGHAARRLYETLGFDTDLTIVELCEWHLERLR